MYDNKVYEDGIFVQAVTRSIQDILDRLFPFFLTMNNQLFTLSLKQVQPLLCFALVLLYNSGTACTTLTWKDSL